MKKQILEELNDIKYLFNYNRGKVISEQEKYESEEIDFEEIDDEDDDEDINYLKGEFNEEYDDDEEYKDRSMYDPYYGDDDEEYDYMVDPNAEETLPSFDSSSSSGKYLGMAKPMGDMDNRTPEERERDSRDIDMEVDEEIIENKGVEVPVRPGIKTPTKPKKPSTPYKPKPGPKPDPKARKRKGDMPDWLTFDELGIDFE
jgi:hypothetical protein